MGQAAMTGLREWCRAGKKLFARIRQMSAKEYTDSVYHKTGVEAARKKRIYTAFISEERDWWLRGNRPAKKSKKLKKRC
jgi:hypothetical protein